jgi:hypothetical protein
VGGGGAGGNYCPCVHIKGPLPIFILTYIARFLSLGHRSLPIHRSAKNLPSTQSVERAGVQGPLWLATGKLLKQVVAGGFYNLWMANAFKRMGGQCF